MPTRVIREGMLTSERVDLLTEQGELFYRRLQQIVDDHGRYPAHPAQLRTNCYPLRIDRYSDAQVLGWRRECEAANLVRVYRVGKVEYLELADFRQQVKSKSKYPGPSDGTPIDPCPSPDRATRTPVHDPYTDRTRTGHDPFTLDVGEDGVEGGGAARASAREEPPPPDLGHDPIDPDRVVPIRAADRFDPGEPTDEGVIAAWLCEQERAAGRQVRGISSLDPKLMRWVADGVTHAQIAEAYRLAVAARVEANDRTPINVGFIDVKLRDLLAKAAGKPAPMPTAPSRPAWERDTASMLAKAREIGLEINGDWTAEQLRWHILQRLRARVAA